MADITVVGADGVPIKAKDMGDGTFQIANQTTIVGSLVNLPTRETWTPLTIIDSAVGGNKIFVVPSGKEYEVLAIYVSFTSTATVGNRNILVFFATSLTEVTGQADAGITQSASTTVGYTIAPNIAKDTALNLAGGAGVTMPKMILSSGQQIIVRDGANVAWATDTASVAISLRQRSV